MSLPKIDRNRCKKHYSCVRICPKEVFEIENEEVQVSNPAACNGCEACVAECPEDAIIVIET